MGEFRLPRGEWGDDDPDWGMRNYLGNYSVFPVGTRYNTKNDENLLLIYHTGNTVVKYGVEVGSFFKSQWHIKWHYL